MDVTFVKKGTETSLVSTVVDGVELRKYVPTNLVREDGGIEPSDFEAGITFGLPLAEIIKPFVHTAEELAVLVENALHNAGLWEEKDFQNANRIFGALQTVYGQDTGAIRKAVREYAAAQKVVKPVVKTTRRNRTAIS